MKNERTQSEWYELAKDAADAIFAKQKEIFEGLTDVIYYYTEVTRFNNFIKIDAAASPRPDNSEIARQIDEYLHLANERIYLSEYTTDEEFKAYAPTIIRKMEIFATAARTIKNSKK